MSAKKVILGISGGVDSSVAALLLKNAGYDVTGLFMLNWEEENERGACNAEGDFEDAARVCAQLDIPYYSVNFADKYLNRVFKYFLEEYKAGRTPNPDVLCNREIKFGPFADYAFSLGADYIATGHYCGVAHEGGRHLLLKAADAGKDQTYFLNQVPESRFEKTLFPLAGLKKEEVREIARKNGLATAKKKDSTGICFIGERNFRNFLKTYLPAQPGEIKNLEGETVGRHEGLMYYTLGQRKGLNLGGRQGEEGRWFVVKKDIANNTLIVSHGDESPLYSRGCRVTGLNFIGFNPPETFNCFAKFRYRQSEQKVKVTLTDGGARVDFDIKQRAVTEGQYAVFYDGRACLGGGVIEQVFY